MPLLFLGAAFSVLGVVAAAAVAKSRGVKNALAGMLVGAVAWLGLFIPCSIAAKDATGCENTRIAIKAIEALGATYKTIGGRYPESFAQLAQPCDSTTRMLLTEVKLDVDALGAAYGCKRTSDSFEIRSAGPDLRMNTADGIVGGSEPEF